MREQARDDPPTMTQNASVAIIGAGPAGLMAASRLARAGIRVDVYDAMRGVPRKFLLAGRGGLNLTNAIPIGRFLAAYGRDREFLAPALRDFDADAVRDFCHELGIETFVGSSGRVFPRCMKASPLVRAWLADLRARGVEFHRRHRWVGIDDDGALRFEMPWGPVTRRHAATLLALGGASWPEMGSDAAWVPLLEAHGVRVVPFRPANCGFEIPWTSRFRERFEATPLKNIRLRAGDSESRGEAMITHHGIEGGGVYDISRALREAIEQRGSGDMVIDLRPEETVEALAARITARPRGKLSTSSYMRKTLRLSAVAIGLLRESDIQAQRSAAGDDSTLPARIKNVTFRVTATRPIDRAISSAGGIAHDEIDEHWMLRKLPGVFVAGEMVDWEAPTGGFLLQACFASGDAAARGIERHTHARAARDS